MPSHMLC